MSMEDFYVFKRDIEVGTNTRFELEVVFKHRYKGKITGVAEFKSIFGIDISS